MNTNYINKKPVRLDPKTYEIIRRDIAYATVQEISRYLCLMGNGKPLDCFVAGVTTVRWMRQIDFIQLSPRVVSARHCGPSEREKRCMI